MDKTPSRLHHFFRGSTATLHIGGAKPTDFKSAGPGRPWFRILASVAVVGALALGVAWGEGKVASLQLRYEAATASQTVKSDNSVRTDAWQAKYGNAISDRKIFYVDSDAIDLAMGVGILSNQPTARAEILMKMIREKTGVWVNPYLLPQLEEGFANGHTEFSVQLERDHGLILRDGPKNTLCVIVPSDPNHSAKGIVAMVAGVPEEGLRWIGADGKPLFDLQTMRDYVDAHETSHCMDARWAGGKEDVSPALSRHKAELFGDVHATLMMAQQGKADIARKLADVRALGLMTAGRAASTRAIQKGSDPAMGVSYSMSFALLATQDYIDKTGLAAIKKMTPAELRAKAYEIVDRTALDDKGLTDLGFFLVGGEKYVEMIQAEPDAPARIATLQRYAKFIGEAAGRLIDRDALTRAALAKMTGQGGDDQGYTQETFEAKVEELWKVEILDRARAQGGGVIGIARAVTDYRNAVRADIAAGKTIDIARMELLKNIGMRLSLLDDATHAVLKQATPPQRQTGDQPAPARRPPVILTEPHARIEAPFSFESLPKPAVESPKHAGPFRT